MRIVLDMRTAAQRNTDAEVRFVEEGHNARLDNGTLLVTSDTHHGKAYRVTADAPWAGRPITFTCTPEGHAAYADDHLHMVSPEPGVVPCKHAAGAARRLAREGHARYDNATGLWVATHKAQQHAGLRPVPEARAAKPTVDDDDPFAGLDQYVHEGHVA